MSTTQDMRSLKHSPTIFNGTSHTIVVFQERGTFYNQQVLQPGEAVSMERKHTGGGFLVPYKVHAVIGDERCFPSRKDSMRNLAKATAVPAAFAAGCLITAMSGGMLAGPSAALAPLVSGMVVRGVVIDAAAIAAGGLLASRAQTVAERLLKEQPDKFMAKTNQLRPGERFLVVTGGLSDGSVEIKDVTRRKFRKLNVTAWKEPRDTKLPVEQQLEHENELGLTREEYTFVMANE